MKKFELISFATPDELARAVAGRWLDEIAAANREARPHCVALSGGRITENFFAATSELARARKISFGRAHFFWADERCVPPEDPESNFRLARERLFAPLKIGGAQIHRIRGELPPEAAAIQAVSEIRSIVPFNASGQPVLDLILLGMGPDGHVASLFPADALDAGSDPAVFRAVTNSPKPPPNRVTIGYATIAAARQVWALISGAGKEAALRESLEVNGRTPFGRVIRSREMVKIFCDLSLDKT
jgi:6-phosphogluconolactonase